MFCTKCNVDKPTTEFNQNKAKKSGYQSFCKSCMKEYKLSYYQENKTTVITKVRENKRKVREWFNDYKSGLACEECGQNHPATLDFHHLDSDAKDVEVGQLVGYGYGKDLILAEVAKCKVLCSNCHRILHYEQKK